MTSKVSTTVHKRGPSKESVVINDLCRWGPSTKQVIARRTGLSTGTVEWIVKTSSMIEEIGCRVGQGGAKVYGAIE